MATTAATQAVVDSRGGTILYMAFELGRKKWKLGFTIGLGQKARRRTIAGGDTAAGLREIAAGRRLRLAGSLRAIRAAGVQAPQASRLWRYATSDPP